MSPERDVGVDAALERDEAPFLEPRALGPGPRLVGELVQRRPAPEGERLAQCRRRALGLAGGEFPLAVVEEELEAGRVERVVLQLELVRMPAGAQHVARGQLTPKLRDEVLHDLGGGRRGVAVPQLLDDAVAGHRAVALDYEQGQQLPLAAAAQRQRAAIVENIQRSEDADFHVVCVRA